MTLPLGPEESGESLDTQAQNSLFMADGLFVLLVLGNLIFLLHVQDEKWRWCPNCSPRLLLTTTINVWNLNFSSQKGGWNYQS